VNRPPTTRPSGRWTGAGGLDRLRPQEFSNLRVEARGLPMQVAALAILEGTPLCDAQGRLRLEVVQS
jgi:hypothetical protein